MALDSLSLQKMIDLLLRIVAIIFTIFVLNIIVVVHYLFRLTSKHSIQTVTHYPNSYEIKHTYSPLALKFETDTPPQDPSPSIPPPSIQQMCISLHITRTPSHQITIVSITKHMIVCVYLTPPSTTTTNSPLIHRHVSAQQRFSNDLMSNDHDVT